MSPSMSAPRSSAGLISCGLIAGPLFCGIVLLQAALRPGFDFVAMPLSLLALGAFGWVQTANFLLTGALILACAVGVLARTSRGAFAVPILVYGAGMACAGIFRSDPIAGFPPGTAPSSGMSTHAMLHGISFGVAQLALSLSCAMMAVRSAQRTPIWAGYSAATGLLTPGLVVFGFSHPQTMGLAFFTTGAVALTWLALQSIRLSRAEDE